MNRLFYVIISIISSIVFVEKKRLDNLAACFTSMTSEIYFRVRAARSLTRLNVIIFESNESAERYLATHYYDVVDTDG